MLRALGILLPVALASVSCVEPRLAAGRLGNVTHASLVPNEARLEPQRQCGDGSLTEAGRQRIVRAPYLQRVTERSALVLFTVRSGAVVVDVSTPRGVMVASVVAGGDGAGDGKSVRQQVARLAGLEPAMIYCYALRGLSARAGFATASQPGQTTRFVALGDSGSGSAAQRAVRDQIARVPFELMLHTGDLAYDDGTLAQFEENHFSVYAPLLAFAPLFPAPGNHDYRTQDGAPFRQVFALPENGGPEGLERWYSFDWGNVHFAAIDTQNAGPVQAAWLEADLASTDRPWKIVFGHNPPFSSGEHGSDADVQRHFVPVFERQRVQLVLSGHDHDYERTRSIRGVTYVVTGGGGRGTRPVGVSDFTAHSDEVFHFLHGEAGEEALRLHAIDATGQIFDSAVIPRIPSG